MVSKDERQKPGPGNYDKEGRDRFGDNAKKVSILGKGKEMQASGIPGPGSYNAKDFLTKDGSRVHGMSQSTRGDIVAKSAKELPGPGAYASNK